MQSDFEPFLYIGVTFAHFYRAGTLPSLIYYKSFREGRVPALWKCANVTPIYKKGSKSDCLNYRPVSLTCNLCKLLERIIKERMITQLMENKWFNMAQNGFSKNKSTVSNLIDFYDAVSEEMDHENPVDIFYIDFAKAFDTVPHSKLMIKPKNLNQDEKIVKWIQGYLHTKSDDSWCKIRIIRSLQWRITGFSDWAHTLSYIY